MANEGDRGAAAILAEEASRQQLEAMSSKGPRDVPGELLHLQEWFLEQLARPAKPAR